MSLNVEKIHDYCRLCQENLGIFLVDDNIVTKIFHCSNIKINDDHMDLFPKSICNRCHLTVEEMFNFIKHIQLTDKRLRDHFETGSDNIRIKEGDEVAKDYSNNRFKFRDKNDVEKGSCFSEDSSITCDHKIVINNDEDGVIKKELYESISNPVELSKGFNSSLKNDLSDEDNSNSGSLEIDLTDDKERMKGIYKNAYPCTYNNCSKVCTSSYTLRTHLMKHEGKTPFLCVTCGKGFTTKNSLNCHEKIHAKIKAYVCTECNIRFSVSSNLRAHQRKHHEGIRYYCSQCPLVYISKYSLERHELVHTGIKEYKCETCKAAFYTNKELTKHQRYHQGLRLYKCEECFKTFFEKHHLTIHIRGHTGERPYACKIPGCGKSFTESQKLTRHLKARHPLI